MDFLCCQTSSMIVGAFLYLKWVYDLKMHTRTFSCSSIGCPVRPTYLPVVHRGAGFTGVSICFPCTRWRRTSNLYHQPTWQGSCFDHPCECGHNRSRWLGHRRRSRFPICSCIERRSARNTSCPWGTSRSLTCLRGTRYMWDMKQRSLN